MPPRLRVGCTSFSYEDLIGNFYPPDTPREEMLRRYAQVFDTVEIDATFYRIPRTDVVARWAQDTPPGFTVTTKLPRRITHDQGMVGVEEVLQVFLGRLEPLKQAGKLGPVVAQFPASFARKKGAEALGPFLDLIPHGIRIAFEFRNKSWWVPDTHDLLRKHGAGVVWQVTHQDLSPPEVTADFLYARLVGPDRAFERTDRIQRDLRGQMEKLRDNLQAHAQGVGEAFLMVSNHFMGHGPDTAAILCEVLGLPKPDMAGARRGGGQAMLGDFG